LAKAKAPIRRFDVFAEYNRQKGIAEGMAADEAEGYGLWVAKVVASRGFGRGALTQKPPEGGKVAEGEEKEGPKKSKWHELSGKPQTDEMFGQEIIGRMGKDFYEQVFVPAIREAIESGKSYTAIRDTIRKQWT
jgi:hypothetical protein